MLPQVPSARPDAGDDSGSPRGFWRYGTAMPIEKLMLGSGVALLAAAALLGYVQHRYRTQPERFARWRVVHAGGTAGAVQLIVLSAVWSHFGHGLAAAALALGLIAATWTFFLGPLAQALEQHRTGKALIGLGAVIAFPTYLALPLVLLL